MTGDASADNVAADDPAVDDAAAGYAAAGDPLAGDPDTVVPSDDDDLEALPGPLITFDNQERLLEEVFAIYSGEEWDTTPLALAPYGPLLEPVRPSPSNTLLTGGRYALVGLALCRSG